MKLWVWLSIIVLSLCGILQAYVVDYNPVAVLDVGYENGTIVIDGLESFALDSYGNVAVAQYIWTIASYNMGDNTAVSEETITQLSYMSELNVSHLSQDYDLYHVSLQVMDYDGDYSLEQPYVIIYNSKKLSGKPIGYTERLFDLSKTLGSGYDNSHDITIYGIEYLDSALEYKDLIVEVSTGDFIIEGTSAKIYVGRGDYVWEDNISGSGTYSDPWQIDSVDDFEAIGYFWEYYDDYYVLTADLTLEDTYSNSIIAKDMCGSPGFQGKSFDGVFDGNGCTITGLDINSSAGEYESDYIGLFGSLTGEVKNLELIDVNISNSSSSSIVEKSLLADVYGGLDIADGVAENCLYLDGEGYVQINDKVIDCTDDFSAFAWVYLDVSAESKPQIILQQLHSDDYATGSTPLYRNVDGYLSSFFIGDSANTALVSDFFLNTNQWYCIGLTYNGSVLNLYANGDLVASETDVYPAYCDGGFRIGAYKNQPGDDDWEDIVRWNGKIDEVKFFNRALSKGEIVNLYDVSHNNVCCYDFENDVLDSIGSYDGVVLGSPVYSDGKYGNSIRLDGSEDYITVNDYVVDTADDFSMFVWLRRDDVLSGVEAIAYISQNANGDAGDTLLGFYDTGVMGACIQGVAVETDGQVYTESLIGIDSPWIHVGLTYADSTIKLYADGVLVGQGTANPDKCEGLTYIGAVNSNGSMVSHWNGYMDDLRFYHRVLSDADIADLYLKSNPEKAYYEFEEECVSDSSGNGCDGQLINGDVVLVDGKIGKSVKLDGDDDYIDIPDDIIDISEEFSILVWTYLDYVDSSNPQILVQKLDGDSVVAGATLLYRNREGNLSAYINEIPITSNYQINAGQWYNLGVTYDGIKVNLYANGEVVYSHTDIVPYHGAGGFILGAYECEPGDDMWLSTSRWNGLIDEVVFYQYCLSEGIIRTQYTADSGPKFEYSFDSYDAFLIRDCTGALAGELDGGIIRFCKIAGTVIAGDNAGGVCGLVRDGKVITCNSTANISSIGDNVGGFAGFSYPEAIISDCYTSGASVAGNSVVGGFIGSNMGQIRNCLSMNTVEAISDSGSVIGGFCGECISSLATNYPVAEITGCFWDVDISMQATSEGGTGLSTSDFLAGSTFIDHGWTYYVSDGEVDGWVILSGEVPQLVCDVNIYYVDSSGVVEDCNDAGSSWPTVYQYIQDAVDDANNGDIVVVAPGEYSGKIVGGEYDNSNNVVEIVDKSIIITSTNPDDIDIVSSTIINADGSIALPRRGVELNCGTGNIYMLENVSSIVDGFTINGGYGPDEQWGDEYHSTGGGIYCKGSREGNVNIIQNCIINDNACGYWGGGIYSKYAGVQISNCKIFDNVSNDVGAGIYICRWWQLY